MEHCQGHGAVSRTRNRDMDQSVTWNTVSDMEHRLSGTWNSVWDMEKYQGHGTVSGTSNTVRDMEHCQGHRPRSLPGTLTAKIW